MKSRVALVFLILTVLAACRHPLAIVGEGDIIDSNGNGFGCSYEDYLGGALECVENDVQGNYDVAYLGVARPGFRFESWDGPCGHLSTGPYCSFQVSALLVAFWDAEFSDFPIPATTAQFVPLTATDAGMDTVGSFSIDPHPGTDDPTTEFKVGLDNSLSWSIDYSRLGQGVVTYNGNVDTFGQFSFSAADPAAGGELRTFQGSFLDRNTFGARVLDPASGLPVAFVSGRRIDQLPDDPTEDTDSDGDGVGNNSDAFPDDPTRSEEDLAEPFYLDNIAGPVVGSRCLTCHFDGGIADLNNAALLFVPPGTPDQDAVNLQVFRDYVDGSEANKNFILMKVRGLAGHGGGVIFNQSSQQYQDLEEFLDLL